MTTARQVAADVLHLARQQKRYASEVVDERVGPLSPQDRRLVTQLVMGVVRRRATLDALLRPFVRVPHAVEDRVWDVLHLGAFQLALLTHIPKHAAVHESVDLASHVGSPRAKGFVNGVLRRVSERVTDEFVDYPYSDTLPFDGGSALFPPPLGGRVREGGIAGHPEGVKSSAPDQRRTPHPNPPPQGGREQNRYRKLTTPVLPDPEASEAAYLAAAFSWPRWLADRWLARYEWHKCLRLGFWFNAPPPLWLRVNKLKGDRETYRLRLSAANIAAEPGDHPQSLKLLDHVPVRDLPGYADGDFTIQDVSAMAVATALNPSPGMRVLDLCAAPGGKTTHLAELMHNRGTIVACDVEQKRLDTVTALCQRLGVGIVEPKLLGDAEEPPAGPFHAALLDVPCSNTGVLGRRPEVRWRIKPTEFEHLIRLQTRLLIQAVERVRPGGVIVYSTCSIEPDENTGVVNAVRRALPGLALEADHAAVPGTPGDGGYWARLRKVNV